MRGARRFRDEGIVDTMSRSEIVVQRSRQATLGCRSRRAVRNAGWAAGWRAGALARYRRAPRPAIKALLGTRLRRRGAPRLRARVPARRLRATPAAAAPRART